MKVWKLIPAMLVVMFVSEASAQRNRFNELVGTWVSTNDGTQIMIDQFGSVFSNSDVNLSGSAGRCIDGGANFCFSGTIDNQNYRCAYFVNFIRGGQNVLFRITRNSWRGCPDGIYSRVS